MCGLVIAIVIVIVMVIVMVIVIVIIIVLVIGFPLFCHRTSSVMATLCGSGLLKRTGGLGFAISMEL